MQIDLNSVAIRGRLVDGANLWAAWLAVPSADETHPAAQAWVDWRTEWVKDFGAFSGGNDLAVQMGEQIRRAVRGW